MSFRPIEVTDQPLLSAIYASTREDEMALLSNWTAEDKSAFLQQQFQAQHTYYQQQFTKADFLIILCDAVPAGRLYVDRQPDDIRIIDIALLPDFRNTGYGQYILRNVLEEASISNKSVSIHVERFNRARHLYDRLGFLTIDDTHPVYLLMKWHPKI